MKERRKEFLTIIIYIHPLFIEEYRRQKNFHKNLHVSQGYQYRHPTKKKKEKHPSKSRNKLAISIGYLGGLHEQLSPETFKPEVNKVPF